VFTTIRNPWHRLVSVYLQKFTENADYKISGNFCPISKRKYTTFAMFVRQCVIGPAYSLLSNAHWYPTVYRNNICNTKINYISEYKGLLSVLHGLTLLLFSWDWEEWVPFKLFTAAVGIVNFFFTLQPHLVAFLITLMLPMYSAPVLFLLPMPSISHISAQDTTE